MPLPRYLSQRIQDFPSPGSPGWLKNTQCESHDVVHRLLKKSHCPQVPRARHLWTSVLLAMAPKLMCLSFARVLRYECIHLILYDCSSSGLLENRHCPLVPRARHLLTRVLLAMAPKVRMHEPDMPGVLFVRIVEKLSLSTGASREAPVDKWARRHTSIHPYILTIPLAWTCLHLPSPAPSPSSNRFHNKDKQKTILFGVHAQVSL